MWEGGMSVDKMESSAVCLGVESMNWEDTILPRVAGVLCRLVKESDLPKSLCALCRVFPST
jgi:hypothetical protein